MSESTHSLTHSLTQHNPGDSMEDWVTNFGIQIGLKPPPSSSIRCDFANFPLLGGRRKKHVSEHKSAPNYIPMKKLHMGWVDFNTKKSF